MSGGDEDDLVVVWCLGGRIDGADLSLGAMTREEAERLVPGGFYGACTREHRIESVSRVNMLRQTKESDHGPA